MTHNNKSTKEAQLPQR